MTSLEQAPFDKLTLRQGIVQLEHGALFLLLPLFCGMLSVFWCSYLQFLVWERYAPNVRRRALRLHRLRFKSLRIPDGSEMSDDSRHSSPKQNSLVNGSIRLSRKLSRRSSEFELDPCQQKLLLCQKENIELQKELSQVYAIKSKFADLLKAEVEKSCSLEKELKVCQSQVVAVRSDRDRARSEMENTQRKEDDLIEKLGDLQDRLDILNSECTEEKSLCRDLEKKLEISNQEVDLYKKVVEKFWGVRCQAVDDSECDSIMEKASSLLQDAEGFWSCGGLNEALHDQCKQATENLVILQVESQVFCDSLANCQAEFEKENNARKQAETALLDCRQQLSCLVELVESERNQLNSVKASLKEDVAVLLLEEKNWILSLPEALARFRNEGSEMTSRHNINGDGPHDQDFKETHGGECNKGDMVKESPSLIEDVAASLDLGKLEKASLIVIEHQKPDETEKVVMGHVMTDETGSRDLVVDNFMLPMAKDDSKEALAQALQEKVAALLLLSQQEERHILEANTTVVLESEISFLKQQLLQVTSEKVDALVELARAHEELMKLQQQEKTSRQAYQHSHTLSSGPSSPVKDYGVFFDDDRHAALANGSKKAPAQSYLKQLWLKGPELGARTKSLSHMLTLKANKENDSVGIARLRVENATLRESLTSIRHLCKSANRLRLIIARIAAESHIQTEASIQAAVDAVDGVISEALHLKVALHSSLPVDDLGWNSIGSPLARASEMGQERGVDDDANDDLDIVSFFGLEIVRLVLLAAQLQKRFLGQNV